MGKPTKRDEFLLHPIIAYEPFDKWGMYFIGPIDPPSYHKNYILVCIDYLKKWTKVKALSEANEALVVEFLYEKIFNKFGVHKDIVIGQGM